MRTTRSSTRSSRTGAACSGHSAGRAPRSSGGDPQFTSRRYTVEDLIARGTLTRPIAEFLAAQIVDGKAILISGGTGTGRPRFSTFLGIDSRAFSADLTASVSTGYHAVDREPDAWSERRSCFCTILIARGQWG